MHAIAIDPALIRRLEAERGGKRHIFDDIDPARTAHAVIDL
jgi:ureidoacrylate peracid hydrolase